MYRFNDIAYSELIRIGVVLSTRCDLRLPLTPRTQMLPLELLARLPLSRPES